MEELYLYTGIDNESAQLFMQAMDAAGSDADMIVRVCSPGGSVFAFWGMAAKLTERKGNTTMKVDGLAASAAAMILLYADSAEALETSTLMIHRADMYISSPEDQALLDKINEDLKAKMSAKIDSKKLKEIKGITIKDLFNPETRIDCFLTAKEAKQIGLISKVNKVNPKEVAAFNDKFFGIAAELKTPIQKEIPIKKINTMDITTLKADHPALYLEIFNAGVAQEKERVEAALVFNEIDPAGVKAAIESGKPISQKAAFEFMLKQNAAEALKKIEKESAAAVTTTAVTAEPTAEEKKKLAAEAELNEKLGLTKKV